MSWSPEQWEQFAKHAAPEGIELQIKLAAQDIQVAELWHRRLSALLITRYRQIADGEWPAQ